MMSIAHALSLNVRFLNGTFATFYVEPHNCLSAAREISHACESVTLFLNDRRFIFDGDTHWTADMLE